MITLQDIFNAAWQAFIVEDRPPAWDDGCKYRTDDGRKCAIGLVIPDGHPAQRVGQFFDAVAAQWPDLFDVPLGPHLIEFQGSLHDNLINLEGQWGVPRHDREVIYRDVAIRYGLTVPEGA